MNYLLYGEDTFLLDQKLNSLKKKYKINEDDMNIMTYWCHETSMDDILADALTPPFLTEYKMVIIKNPLFLTTSKQKDVSEADMNKLLDYLAFDNPSTLLVIYHDVKNFDERKKIVKAVRKYCNIYEADKLTAKQIYRNVKEMFKSKGCTIDQDALDLLLSRLPDDLLTITNEVDKLCLYTKNIHIKDVNLLVNKRIEENVHELTSAYLSKDIGKAFSIYKDLMIKNEEPIGLIALIGSAMRTLYQVKLLDRKGYNDQEIAKMLSMNVYRLKYIRADANRFELKELLDRIEDLSDLDIKIKTGKIDKYKGLEIFLLNIKGGHNGIA
jgi:DNA polymerase-3 subunit delta